MSTRRNSSRCSVARRRRGRWRRARSQRAIGVRLCGTVTLLPEGMIAYQEAFVSARPTPDLRPRPPGAEPADILMHGFRTTSTSTTVLFLISRRHAASCY